MKLPSKPFIHNTTSQVVTNLKKKVNKLKENRTICCVVCVKWCVLQEWLNILWQLKIFIFIRLGLC